MRIIGSVALSLLDLISEAIEDSLVHSFVYERRASRLMA